MSNAVSGPVVHAAGALPWRVRRGRVEVLLVHRPRYDDWAWAKGKLDPGEDWPGAAVREVAEETGLEVQLGRPLPPATYRILDRAGQATTKRTRYWTAQVVGGDGVLHHEIDEVAWLDVAAASDRLTYARDRDQLRALVSAENEQALDTWPLLLVRHAKARPRGGWRGNDPQRPLDAAGKQRAAAIVPLLGAYGVRRLVSSPSVRCTDTFAPYAESRDLRLRLVDGFSEEGYAARPDRALRHLQRVLRKSEPAAVCSHGPVLPDLVAHLAGLADVGPLGTLAGLTSQTMAKGEALVCHLTGAGEQARVVAVERHQP